MLTDGDDGALLSLIGCSPDLDIEELRRPADGRYGEEVAVADLHGAGPAC